MSLRQIDISTDIIFSLPTSHCTPLYATAFVDNFAGLRSVLRSNKLFVDQTPPILEDIQANLHEIDLKKSNMSDTLTNETMVRVRVKWNVTDPESGIEACSVSVGKFVFLGRHICFLFSKCNEYGMIFASLLLH